MAGMKRPRSRVRSGVKLFNLVLCAGIASAAVAQEQPRRPVEGIMDNSFLIEEAYNQEAGIVQHIFNGVYSVDRISGTTQRRLDLSFTQEWPAYGQAHQFSYTIPYSIVDQRTFDPLRGQT